MAVRSGAGTGVIVSLVVFVITTFFMLILSIMFFAGKAEALEAQAQAESDLARYVKPQQRNSDLFKRIEESALANNQSVAAFLSEQRDQIMRYVNGDAAVPFEQLKAQMERYGIEEGDTIRGAIEGARRDLRQRQTEIDSLKNKLEDREGELAEKQAQIAQMREDQKTELQMVSREITTYREAADQYRQDLQTTIGEMNDAVDRLKQQYEDRIADLEDELDGANQEVVLMRARVDEYEKIFNEIRTKATSPDLLVDGEVIDVELANEQIFINRGRRDRIVLGMTFEIYDDAASIRPLPNGALPRGKASLQVVKVGESTSTCKLTRIIPGRPVVRGNVIANAIYDPTYRFKFLIHGKFDVDGDGRVSEAEAEYLRSLVVDWGGEIVMGEDLPGDLDFLVLGEMPPMPPALGPNATETQTRIWVSQRAARLKYEELFRQASEAQIPVINANRFFVLLGRTGR